MHTISQCLCGWDWCCWEKDWIQVSTRTHTKTHTQTFYCRAWGNESMATPGLWHNVAIWWKHSQYDMRHWNKGCSPANGWGVGKGRNTEGDNRGRWLGSCKWHTKARKKKGSHMLEPLNKWECDCSRDCSNFDNLALYQCSICLQ